MASGFLDSQNIASELLNKHNKILNSCMFLWYFQIPFTGEKITYIESGKHLIQESEGKDPGPTALSGKQDDDEKQSSIVAENAESSTEAEAGKIDGTLVSSFIRSF